MSSLCKSAGLGGAVLLISGALSAQVVINEVYYDAPSGDDGQVFVELYGTPGTDIGGWSIQGIEGSGTAAGGCNPDSFTFPSGTVIDASGFVVVADELGSTGTTMVAVYHFIDSDMDLENGEDALQLVDASGSLVDAVAYGPVNTAVGPLAVCNGLGWYEGNPARDVFAPLSIERCPAGRDSGDNAIDFTPNVPTPGAGESCCTAIEYVSHGSGNSLTLANGDSVGLDVWSSCSAGQLYLILASFTDPTVTPPPPGLPVWDATTPVISTLANLPPFVAWAGTLGPNGELVGTAALDFSSFTGLPAVSPPLSMYIGAIAFQVGGGLAQTNHVEVVWN